MRRRSVGEGKVGGRELLDHKLEEGVAPAAVSRTECRIPNTVSGIRIWDSGLGARTWISEFGIRDKELKKEEFGMKNSGFEIRCSECEMIRGNDVVRVGDCILGLGAEAAGAGA